MAGPKSTTLLPVAGPITGAEKVALVQNGQDVQSTLLAIMHVSPPLPIRGMYTSILVDSGSGITHTQIQNEVNAIAAAGFNTVFLGLNPNNNGVAWPNPSFDGYQAMSDPTVTYPAFDAVADYLTKGQAVGLKVHAWFQGMNGGLIRQEFAPTGTPSNCYNHHFSGYRNYCCAAIREALARYPQFDGVHLAEYYNVTDIWGLGSGSGPWINEYYQDTGRNTYATDYTGYHTNGQIGSATYSQMGVWIWAHQEAFLRQLVATIRDADQTTLHRPISWFGSAKDYQYTTGERMQQWVNSGLIDFMVDSQYGDTIVPGDVVLSVYGGTDSNGALLPALTDPTRASLAINLYLDSVARALTGAEVTTKLTALYGAAPTSGVSAFIYAQNPGNVWLTAGQIAAFAAWFSAH